MNGFRRGRIAAGSALALIVATTTAVQSSAAAAAAGVACGDVLTKSTTLTADVGPCAGTGDGIIIGADRITLDLAGHRIFRTGDPADNAGVRLGRRQDVTVKGGSVSGFGTGVAIQGGSGNTVDRMDIHGNVGLLDGSGDLGDGIGIFNSSRNVVANSRIAGNGPYEGIGVFGNGKLGRNTTKDNVIRGNTIENNNVLRTDGGGLEPITLDDGINLGAGLNGGSHTSILNNVIRGNGLNGIDACSIRGNPCFTDHNVIRGNLIEANGFGNLNTNQEFGDGLRVTSIIDQPGGDSGQPTYNVVDANVIRGNASTGLFLATLHNLITGNEVVGNGASGTVALPRITLALTTL